MAGKSNAKLLLDELVQGGFDEFNGYPKTDGRIINCSMTRLQELASALEHFSAKYGTDPSVKKLKIKFWNMVQVKELLTWLEKKAESSSLPKAQFYQVLAVTNIISSLSYKEPNDLFCIIDGKKYTRQQIQDEMK